MFLELEDGLGLREVVDDDVENNENTCSEAVVISIIVGALTTHPHFHFWSNGVGQFINTKVSVASGKNIKWNNRMDQLFTNYIWSCFIPWYSSWNSR